MLVKGATLAVLIQAVLAAQVLVMTPYGGFGDAQFNCAERGLRLADVTDDNMDTVGQSMLRGGYTKAWINSYNGDSSCQGQGGMMLTVSKPLFGRATYQPMCGGSRGAAVGLSGSRTGEVVNVLRVAICEASSSDEGHGKSKSRRHRQAPPTKERRHRHSHNEKRTSRREEAEGKSKHSIYIFESASGSTSGTSYEELQVVDPASMALVDDRRFAISGRRSERGADVHGATGGEAVGKEEVSAAHGQPEGDRLVEGRRGGEGEKKHHHHHHHRHSSSSLSCSSSSDRDEVRAKGRSGGDRRSHTRSTKKVEKKHSEGGKKKKHSSGLDLRAIEKLLYRHSSDRSSSLDSRRRNKSKSKCSGGRCQTGSKGGRQKSRPVEQEPPRGRTRHRSRSASRSSDSDTLSYSSCAEQIYCDGSDGPATIFRFRRLHRHVHHSSASSSSSSKSRSYSDDCCKEPCTDGAGCEEGGACERGRGGERTGRSQRGGKTVASRTRSSRSELEAMRAAYQRSAEERRRVRAETTASRRAASGRHPRGTNGGQSARNADVREERDDGMDRMPSGEGSQEDEDEENGDGGDDGVEARSQDHVKFEPTRRSNPDAEDGKDRSSRGGGIQGERLTGSAKSPPKESDRFKTTGSGRSSGKGSSRQPYDG